MQAYVVRIALRGKAHDDPVYMLLNEKMGAAQFGRLPDTPASNKRRDRPYVPQADYFTTQEGEADDILKKAKAIANSICESNIVVVWTGFSEGDGRFSFDSMSCLSDDI